MAAGRGYCKNIDKKLEFRSKNQAIPRLLITNLDSMGSFSGDNLPKKSYNFVILYPLILSE